MAGPTMKATELLKCNDVQFDDSIKLMGMKALVETISVLQKEMSREQENLNSLSSELGSLKKNSQQYKQIQREVNSSQGKLTLLMNRSMKCFQQQGNHHVNKGAESPSVKRKSSFSGDAKKRLSAEITKPLIDPSRSKSTPVIASEASSTQGNLKPFSDAKVNGGTSDNKGNFSSTVGISSSHSNGSTEPHVVKSSFVNVKMNSAAKPIQDATSTNRESDSPKVNSSMPDSGKTSSVHSGGEKKFSSCVSVQPSSTNNSVLKSTGDVKLSKPSTKLDKNEVKNESKPNDVKVGVVKKETPAVVYEGNRPYLVDQNLAENRNLLLDQIKNFPKGENSGLKSVPQNAKERKQVFDSDNKSAEKDSEQLKKKSDEITKEEVDSGAEDGSSEPSPEPEKYVSKFSFPQKPKRDPVKLEEKRKASASNEQNSQMSVQEEITLGNQSERDDEDHEQTENGSGPSSPREDNCDLSAEEKALAQDRRGAEEEGDDEVVPVRVNLTNWDPTKLLMDLYSVNLMSDNVEDISDKFIIMEGLMEKLPMNKKKATLLKTWKRRFFRAKDGWLHYFETGARDKPSDSLQLMGGRVDDLGNRILGIDDGRGRYLMVRCPTDKEYGQWKLALESQTADNVRATYIRPALQLPKHPDKNVVVIDIGSSAIRAGILGEQATLPQLFFPSTVARNKKTDDLVTGIEAYTPSIRQNSELRKPVYPTDKVDKDYLRPFGIDIETIASVFKKIFTELNIDSTKYWVMISTPQNLGDKIRTGLMDILIDQFNVKGVSMVMQSLLALYSYNTTSGIIVDIGERMEILPIYDGYVIEGGVSRQSYGGQKVAQSLNYCLGKYKFSTPIQQLLVRYVMEQSCYVSMDYKETLRKCEADPDSYKTMVSLNNYDLPEGADVTVTHDYSCFKSPEGFFNTDLWGMDYPCVHKLVFKAIQSCPMDGRKRMYRAVYLSGGVTLLPGFAERLQHELSKLAPPSVVVEVHAAPNRYHSAFIGACSLANMEQFQTFSITAAEWKKEGAKAFKKWNMS